MSLNQFKKALLPLGVHGAYIVVKSQLSPLSFEVNPIEIAYSLQKIRCPRKEQLFHATRIPPEAPKEGRNSKESKEGGQMFLMKLESKLSFLVSWRQMMSLLDSMILSFTEFHFLSELIPLTFQFKIFQLLVFLMSNKKEHPKVTERRDLPPNKKKLPL